MATAERAAPQLKTGGPPVSQILKWIFGAVLILGVLQWLIRVIIEEPSRFAEVSLIGFTNGTIIALIALGYTLVYGIIELINFAHGDNFMLGSFQTNSIITDGSFQIPLYPTTLVLGIPLGRPPSRPTRPASASTRS